MEKERTKSDRTRGEDGEREEERDGGSTGGWRERVLLTKQICTHVLIHLSPSQSYLRS